MIRVLQCVNNMHRAGLETMLMNYYRNIDREVIQFDFLTHRPERSDYDDEIEELGGKVYYAPRLMPQNLLEYRRWMKDFFENHPEYVIMHSHIDAMSYIPLLEGKRNEIPVRIAHSHSTSIDKDFKYPMKCYYKSRINSVATDRFSCGIAAGDFLFGGENYIVIPNAVDAKKYKYSEIIRNKKRKEFGLNDEFVIGHVGRFYYPKNHKFMLDIFKELLKIEPNSILFLVGTGEKMEEIKKYAQTIGVFDKVIFAGNRSDVNDIYQLMDVFVLPSLFEGVPLVGVEAQFSGLPCFFSSEVPDEVKFEERVHFVQLAETPYEWAQRIICEKSQMRDRSKIMINNRRFDIAEAHQTLEKYYIELFEKVNYNS